MTINYIISVVSGASAAIIALIGLVFKKINSKLNFIAFAIIFSFLEDLLARYLAIKYHDNSWMFCFTTPIEYILFSLFLYYNSNNISIKRLTLVSYVCLYTYVIVNLIIYHKPYPATFYVFTFTSFFLSVLAITYCRDLLQPNIKFVLDIPILVVVTGLLFYNSFSAIYFCLLIYLADTPTKYLNPIISLQVKQIAPLIELTTIMMYLCIAAGLLISMFKKIEMAKL